MARWVCPRCDREFGGVNQAHVCEPGITVAELLGRHPGWVGEIYQQVADHVRALGPVHEDAVNVGIFLKSDRTLAEFRPRVRSVNLWLMLADRVDDPRMARVVPTGRDRFAHMVKLTSAAEVEDQVRDWLTEAYAASTD